MALIWATGWARAATITVTSSADSGAGSLRQAIADATDGDTILFNLSAGNETISINSQLAVTGKGLTINGENAAGSGVDVTLTVSELGAGWRVFQVNAADKVVAIENMMLKGGNIGEGGGNGGVILLTAGTLHVSDGGIYDGWADCGGGIYVSPGATAHVARCTFNGLWASTGEDTIAWGGALYAGGTLTVSNCTAFECYAQATGAGIYIASNATALVVNSTFASCGNYGGPSLNAATMMIYGTLTMRNSIVVKSENAHDLFDVNKTSSGTWTDGGYNVVQNSTGITLASTSWTSIDWLAYQCAGQPSVTGVLHLATTLADNGGKTDTLEFTNTASFARAGGTGAIPLSAGGGTFNNSPATDQRGVSRSGTNTSIGAYNPVDFMVIPANGPFAGGNTIGITNCTMVLGNGADITNLIVGGVGTTNITRQGTDWVVFVAPATGSAGLKDIVIQSTSEGNTTFAGAYTVNPAGVIGWMYDDWNQWSEVAGLPIGRARLAVVAFNGSIYAIGGYCFSSAQSSVYRFDGTNWTEVSALPASRYWLAAHEFNGGLYAIGGENDDFPFEYNTTYRFDGTNWTVAADLPAAVSAHAVGSLNGTLYTLAGLENHGDVGQTVYAFDGASWSWPNHDLPAPRASLAAGTLNNRLYALGGYYSMSYNANVYAFDGTNWQEVAGLPAGRSELGGSVLDSRLYAIAGRSESTVHTNVYRYDGTNWQEVAGLPAARYSLGAATLGGAIYAVGGYPSDSMNERTNVYRYPARVMAHGVEPSSGAWTGSYPVVIVGENLGNGADITNVMLCGVSVSNITSQSATQVVVVAGASGSSSTGDVVVFSTSYGETIKSNGFSYEGSTLVVLYDFYMQQANGGVSVCWQTASEEDTVGFDLFRWDGDAWVKVNDVLIPGSGEMGGSYRVADAAADAENTFRYKLVEYETDGGMQEYGPFDVAAINLRLENIAITPEGVVLRWLSREQDTYEVQKSLDISNGFSPLATGLPATPPVNVYTDQTETANGAFYRVRVEE